MKARTAVVLVLATLGVSGFTAQAENPSQSSSTGPTAQVPDETTVGGPAPSWQLIRGAPDTCDVTGGFPLDRVYVNIPEGEASEQGVLSAPGHATLGETHDSAFGPFVGFLSGFFVFVSPSYTLPAHTPLTLEVTTYNGTNYTGGVSYVSTITWDCTTGTFVGAPVPALSQNMLMLLGLGLLAVGALVWSRKMSGHRRLRRHLAH